MNRRIRNIAMVMALTSVALLGGGLILIEPAVAGSVRDQNDAQDIDGLGARVKPLDAGTLPAGTRIVRDVAYGTDPKQRFDVYAPAQTTRAPVIFMVHGGGWFRGDKSMAGVVENKVKRWIPRGFIVISVNNRLIPDATPLVQAQDVARALATAQTRVADWGGDSTKFVLMGHSAGAHLIALISASPTIASAAGAKPWLGSVLLDSAALDVPQLMDRRHFPLYDKAFGADRASWLAASPIDALARATPPILAVCSSRRLISCQQSDAFAAKASKLGSSVRVLREDLSHGDINNQLGETGAYTDAVETFLRSLDRQLAALLSSAKATAAGNSS